MPKELEQQLKKTAKLMGYGEERTARYIYGTMRKTGWAPSTQRHKAYKKLRKKIKK